MNPFPPETTPEEAPERRLRIYFLPNLMTAGNLVCGFVAITKIVETDSSTTNFRDIRYALGFILLACIFDLLDGRLARMGGVESPFGREFDSLADIISFGAAPAFLVHRVVLKGMFPHHPDVAWFIASIYLVCGALRLARFNCLAVMPGSGGGKEFLGFPIPAAAGLVASVTLFLMWDESGDKGFATSQWRFLLPVMMLFLSIMMVSEVKYPSFKSMDLKARRTFSKMVLAVLFIGGLVILRNLILPVVLPALLTLYLLYGFIRPRISRQMRRGIEEEDDEEGF
jgi:CDP-diacylglycerol--serine O-phosphatidyltransferase